MPKCAGTSLRRAIDSALYPSDDGSCSTVRIETRPSAAAARMAGMEVQDFREQMLLYFMADPRCQFISGHLSFSGTAYRHYAHEWEFITLLRHPVSRWLSHYYFNRFKENSHTPITMELEDFLQSERARQFGSEYVRRLSPCIDKSTPPGQTAIRTARKNLSRMSLVGTLEQLDLFCDNFEERFGARLQLQRFNPSPVPDQLQRSLVDKDVRRKIEQLCQPDMQIYEAVQH